MDQDNVLREQYKNADKLNTRISIHEKYSDNKTGFGNWIFSHYDIKPGHKILELGCGTGDMWKRNLDMPGDETKLFLTDLSEGMISAARENLGEHAGIFYQVVNIEQIPYENGQFDRIIANMMLYHVPDLEKGLSEVSRVLKSGGVFYCATYGENGIVPYIVDLLKEYDIVDGTNKKFTLQNGKSILERHFNKVQRFDYEDALAVTDIEDLLDYLYSLPGMSGFAELERGHLKSILQGRMTDGVLNIPKEYGMFVCGK